jgi:hypothetical protein
MELNFNDIPIRGIDISKYDLKLLIEKLLTKVHFVIVRIGHGTKTDPLFKIFWSILKDKIFRISYFYIDYYSHTLPEYEYVYGLSNYEWGKVQGRNAWSNIKDDHDIKLTYADVEDYPSSTISGVDAVWDRVETILDGFFDVYDTESGIINGIYASLNKFAKFSQRFRHRPAYVAWYDEDDNGKVRTRESVIIKMHALGWTGPIHFWQYARNGDTGTDGIGDGLEFGLGREVMDLDAWMQSENEWNMFKKGEINMDNILLDISPLAQRDPSWASIQLGTSSKTIGSHGCLITSATMMLRYFGKDLTPATLNTWLKANNGYQNSNWFVWSSLKYLDDNISFRYRYEYAAMDKVDEQLMKGIPSIINVDMIPETAVLDEHWVLVIGKVDGSYIINDPWYGTTMKFEEKYGAPSKGMHIVCTYNFTGEIAPLPGYEEPEMPEPMYKVNINPGITQLIIRSEPIKTDEYKTGQYAKYPETYLVYEERNGYGKIGVSKWISLSSEYVTKVPLVPTQLSDSEKLAMIWEWFENNVL